MSPYEIKKEICEIGKRLYANGYITASNGNISVKAGPNEFYCTPTGVSKGFLTPDMIVRVDADGNKVEGKLEPSSEIKMHMDVYKERSDVNAVIHAHPATATGFAVANIPLDKFIMPEAVLYLGTVPICDYGTPTTDMKASLAPYIQDHDALLLQNQGALTVGTSLLKAFFNMETLEFYAKISLIASQLGGEQELPCEELENLIALRKKFQIPGKHPGCQKCVNLGTDSCRCKQNTEEMDTRTDGDLVTSITKKVLSQIKK